MYFKIVESIKSRVRNQRSAARNYVVTWKADNELPGGGTDPDIVDISNAAGDGLEFSNPHLARLAVEAWMLLPANFELEDPADANSASSIVYGLHGMPSDTLNVTEVEGTEGRVYDVDASWGLEGRENRSSVSKNSLENNNISENGEGQISKSTTLSVSYPGTTRDYFPLVYAFVRESTFTEAVTKAKVTFPLSDDELKKVMPFPLGSVNAVENTSNPKNAKVGGATISAPTVHYNLTYEVTESPVQASFIANMARAANEGIINSDIFTIAGSTYQPGELLFVSFSANTADNKTVLNLGFSVGSNIHASTNKVDIDPTYLGEEFVDFEGLVRKGTGNFKMLVDSSSDSEPGSYTLQDSEFFYNHFQYVWRYLTNTETVSEVQYVFIHNVWKRASFSDLFGGVTSL